MDSWKVLNASLGNDSSLFLCFANGRVRVFYVQRESVVGYLDMDHADLELDNITLKTDGQRVFGRIAMKRHHVMLCHLRRDTAAVVLAGWQWARSLSLISRQAYVTGRDVICSNDRQCKSIRTDRRRLTRASAQQIGLLMRAGQ